METKLITNLNEFKEIEQTYFEAFPEVERIDVSEFFDGSHNGSELIAFYDNNTFVGFTYIIKQNTTLFIYYLAINKEFRGQGYGSKILQTLISNNPGYSIFLDVEKPDPKAENYEQQLKRISFYEKNGLKLINYTLFYDIYFLSLCYGELDIKTYVKILKETFNGIEIYDNITKTQI